MDVIRYKHSRNAGDLIAVMAGMQQIYRDTGKKAVIYQTLDFEAYYYDGAKHATTNDNGIGVCMNRKQWEMLLPLIENQQYISHCEIFKGQQFDIDLDAIMHDKMIPMPAGDLHQWTFLLVPEMSCDLSDTWLSVEFWKNAIDKMGEKIIINRTERYNNPHINYYFLNQYPDKIFFAGTIQEWVKFNNQWGLSLPLLEVNNFLELAQAIYTSRFFIGNQSMCWHIAEALKVDRILEYCTQFPNTHPKGANGHYFVHQQAVELYVHKLFNQ